jgi:hypothetical protein
MRCGECGRALEPVDRYDKTKTGEKGVICYYLCREGGRRKETCSNKKSVRSDRAHAAVWELVSGLLTDPACLRAGLDAMIEEQRRSSRGDPAREAKAWLEKLTALDRKRSGYLDLAAERLMSRDELRSKLAELQEVRETAERELVTIEGRKERLEQMERDRDTLMERYASVVPESLDALTSEKRHQLYKMLRLEVIAHPDKSLEVSGAIVGRRGVGGEWSEGGSPDGVGLSGGLGAWRQTRSLMTPPSGQRHP